MCQMKVVRRKGEENIQDWAGSRQVVCKCHLSHDISDSERTIHTDIAPSQSFETMNNNNNNNTDDTNAVGP